MKKFTIKGMVQKTIISLLVVIMVNFTIPVHVNAGIISWAGNTIGEAILTFTAFLGDTVVGGLHKFVLGTEDMFSSVMLPSDNPTVTDGDLKGDATGDAIELDGSSIGTDGVGIPNIMVCPEYIFENRIPLLDANFVNPGQYIQGGNSNNKTTGTITGGALKTVIASWYRAFRNIAIVGLLSILVYIGIRILLGSTSQDKAKYKERLVDWLVGLCLVFVMHYIMAGTMMITENITYMLSKSIDSTQYDVVVTGKLTSDGAKDTVSVKENLTGYVRLMAQTDNLSDSFAYTLLYIIMIIFMLILYIIKFILKNKNNRREKMNTYTTQMDAARKGIVTPQIKTVAEKEHMPVEKLMQLVAEGKVAICANKHHKSLNPEGVGSMLRTKINVNLGVSRDCKDYDIEMQKVMSAVNMGAEAIMDLSSHGDTQPFRRKLTSECPAMIGTVPVYDSVIHYQRDLATLTAQDFIDVVRMHAEDGVDFVTLHCGITRKTIDQIKKHKRKMNIVSRGGSLVFAWMTMTGEENPFYEYYDEILEICEEHDVTISLGDACRPGCLADATDVCQIEELVRLGELTKRAWDHNVQVMVEGPGHVPLDQVAANMKVQQSICMGAPFYVLGPLVTDIAPGYDHITSAIGGAVAAMNGAAFLCYVTPAEHLALPNVEDVKQGIIASKIAAHAADIAKGIPGARDIDDKMADAPQISGLLLIPTPCSTRQFGPISVLNPIS